MSARGATTRLLAAALIAGLLGACAASRGRPDMAPGSGPVGDIAGALISMAELRVDLSAVRVGVRPIETAHDSGAVRGAGTGPDVAQALSTALQTELALALSARMNVIDAGLSEEWPGGESGEETGERERVSASHLVVGDYLARDDSLLVTVRLVELESLLIVATARGEVDPETLVDAGRFASRTAAQASASAGPVVVVATGDVPSSSPTASPTSTTSTTSSSPAPRLFASETVAPTHAPSTPSSRVAAGPRGARPLDAGNLKGIGEPATARPARRREKAPDPAPEAGESGPPAPPEAGPPAPATQSPAARRAELVREAQRLAGFPTEHSAPGPAAQRLQAAGKPLEKDRKKP